MHYFNHGPAGGIWPMFSKTMLHFQELEKLLEILKFIIRCPCWNKWKIATNCMYLFFFYVLSPFATCTTTISRPHEACNFSFFMWALKGQKQNCLKITPSLTLLHFLILECLMKESSFWTSNFSLPLMSK
jgi:hypothetical protein